MCYANKNDLTWLDLSKQMEGSGCKLVVPSKVSKDPYLDKQEPEHGGWKSLASNPAPSII